MNIFNIIAKSQKHEALLPEEIHWLIHSYAKGDLPDYQVAAWLATVFLKPLSVDETFAMTRAIIETGQTMTWDFKAVDKHSTGGVGDKTSLIIGPLVSSLGYKVPMMSGRGLGHTGGTLDKLESIPGFQTQTDLKNFHHEVSEKNIFFIGQTPEICPADKKLYALRDATHTVASIPLICSSIMSKKISEGLSGLVLDVKFGSGAFMPDLSSAKDLASHLLKIADKNNINTYAVLSSMEQPLGRYIGNRLEVKECLEIMKNPADFKEVYRDNYELSLLLSALMVSSIDDKYNVEQAFKLCKDQLHSGKVYTFFDNIVKNQKGSLEQFKISAKEYDLLALEDGFMHYNDVRSIGLAAVFLGAGRKTMEDTIDPNVGFYCYKKEGEPVKKGEPLFKVYFNDQQKLQECLEHLNKGFMITHTGREIKTTHCLLKIENSQVVEMNDVRHY